MVRKSRARLWSRFAASRWRSNGGCCKEEPLSPILSHATKPHGRGGRYEAVASSREWRALFSLSPRAGRGLGRRGSQDVRHPEINAISVLTQ